MCIRDRLSRVLMIKNHEIKNRGKGTIAILAAGTSDISVADEAYYTAKDVYKRQI